MSSQGLTPGYISDGFESVSSIITHNSFYDKTVYFVITPFYDNINHCISIVIELQTLFNTSRSNLLIVKLSWKSWLDLLTGLREQAIRIPDLSAAPG